MSEINYYCDEVVWEKPLMPDVCLMQCINMRTDIELDKTYKAGNGVFATQGRYGLTLFGGNDPFVIFTLEPVIDPNPSDEEFETWSDEQHEEYWKLLKKGRQFDKELTGNIKDMARLYMACVTSGYDEEKDGCIGIWLMSYISKYLKNNKPTNIYEWVNKETATGETYLKLFNSEQVEEYIKNMTDGDMFQENRPNYTEQFEKLRNFGKKNDELGNYFDIEKYIENSYKIIKVNVTTYKGFIVITPTSDKEDKNFFPVGGNRIGSVLVDTQTRLGMSKEAVELLQTAKIGQDSIGDISYHNANGDRDCFSWIGSLHNIFPVDKIILSRDSIKIPRHITIENNVPEEAINVIKQRISDENL